MRQQHLHRGDLLGAQTRGSQRQRGIDAGVREVAGRVQLDRHFHQRPALAQAACAQCQIGTLAARGQVTGVQAKAPLIRLRRATESRTGQCRGGQPADAGPARVHALGPGAVAQKLHAARRHRQHHALRVLEGGQVQPHQLAGRQRAPKSPDQPGRVKSHIMETTPSRRTQARSNLNRQHVSCDHLGPRRMPLRRQTQRQRESAGAGMRDRAGVGVVEVQPVDQDAIYQHRIAQRQGCKGAHDGAVTRAAQGLQAAVGTVREILPGRGQGNAQCVEHQQLGLFDHGRRQHAGLQPVREGGQLGSDAGGREGCRVG